MSRVSFKDQLMKQQVSDEKESTQQSSTRPSTTQVVKRFSISQSKQRPSTQSKQIKMPKMNEFQFQTEQNFYKGGKIEDEDEIQSQVGEQINIQQQQQPYQKQQFVNFQRKRAKSIYNDEQLQQMSFNLKDKLQQRKEASMKSNQTHVRIKSLLNWKQESLVFTDKEKEKKTKKYNLSSSKVLENYERSTDEISSSRVIIDENKIKQNNKDQQIKKLKDQLKKYIQYQKYSLKESTNVLENMLNFYVSNAAELDLIIPDKLKNIMWKHQIKLYNSDDLAMQKLTQSRTYIPEQTVENLNKTMTQNMRNINEIKSNDYEKRQFQNTQVSKYSYYKLFKPEPPSQRKRHLKMTIKEYQCQLNTAVQNSHEIDQQIQSNNLLNPLYNHRQQLYNECLQFEKKLDHLNKFDI